MTNRPRLYPRHQHLWSTDPRPCTCPRDPDDYDDPGDPLSSCPVHGWTAGDLVRCEVCDLEMPRNVVEAYDETPTDLVYVPGRVSEAEAEQLRAAIRALPPEQPDTDIRCTHQDGAGQCLDHQGHLGDHQWPAQ